MSIDYRTMDSEEMKGVIRFVKQMTKSMTFDEHMESANWPRMRRRNNFFYRLMPVQKDVSFKKVKLGAQKGLLATVDEYEQGNVIIYLHGGGFVTGSAFVSKSYVSMLAKYAKNKVYAVEYSLAPEKPFPNGFEDCCEALEAIIAMHPEEKITLVGESAGGNYCLALAHKYKDTRKIACVIAHSPTVDFSGCLDHNVNENTDFIVKKGCLGPLTKMYVGENDPKNPYISPLYGDFTNFPPTFITCDAGETLYADAHALYEKCLEAGVQTEFVEAKGTYHAFAVSGTNTPETTRLLEENIAFMRDCWRK